MATAKQQHNVSAQNHRERLHELVKSASTVMLLSHGDASTIVGRPMAVARDEIQRDPRVSVAVQAGHSFVMIEGECRVSQDRRLIDELWQDGWKPWFAGGKTSPEIAILVVTPSEGTYWDGGLGNGLSYLYRMVVARVTGDEMERRPNDQATVDRKHS